MKTLFVSLLLCAGSMFAEKPSPVPQKHPFTFEDMMKLKRVGAPVPSPDGKWVVFDCIDVDLEENTRISHLWIVPASGGESKRLNPTPNHEERPRFSPDGKRLIWTSKATVPTQIWMCDFDSATGQPVGKPHQLTSISTGADGGIWSPDGKNIVFVSAVYPDCKDDACNKQRDEELKKSKVKAKIFPRLFYRHWNAFTEFKRSHLFVVSAYNEAGMRETIPARDLTPSDHDVPPFSLGGQDMYAISPDGQEVAYTSNIDEVEATSTNNEIFVVPINGGTPKKISTSPGADTTPLYSPDGKYLAWLSQARAGFEADKWRLLVQGRQTGKIVNLTDAWNRSASQFTWAKVNYPNGLSRLEIFLTGESDGETPVWHVSPDQPDSAAYFLQLPIQGRPSPQYSIGDLVSDGKDLYFTRNTVTAPNEIWKQVMPNGETIFSDKYDPEQLTHMNDALLSQIDMQPLETFDFKGANDDLGTRLSRQAARIRSEEEIFVEVFASRRTARRMGKRLDISLERGVVRGDRKLRGGDDQFPWLDRLRAEVYRFDQRRLGRETVRRSDEGTRLRGENVSLHRQEPRGGARGELWRLHGELDPRPHEPFQMHRVARRHV